MCVPGVWVLDNRLGTETKTEQMQRPDTGDFRRRKVDQRRRKVKATFSKPDNAGTKSMIRRDEADEQPPAHMSGASTRPFITIASLRIPRTS